MENATMLHGDQLPSLPDDGPSAGLPPMSFSPQGEFAVNAQSARPVHGIPKFYIKAVRKAGGGYDNVEMVDIITPGDSKAMPTRKVTAGIIEKYRPYYEMWKREQSMAPVGTPIEMWPRTTPAMVHELKARNIFTVEQLADVADSNLSNIPFGRTLQNEAREYLKAKEKSDVIEAAAAKTQALQDGMRMMEENFARERDAMRTENADLKAQIAAILARMSEPAPAPAPAPVAAPAAEPPKRGPGRPPKADTA